MADMVPLEWLIIVAAGAVLIIGALLVMWLGNRDTSTEGKIFTKARNLGLPILEVADMSTNHAKWFLGEKDEDGDPMFEVPGLPMKIDPSMCSGSAVPLRYGNGLNIWSFASSKSLPLSVDSMLAFETMIAHRKDKPHFKIFADVPDNELFSLIRISKAHLMDAAPIYISKYKLLGIRLPDESEATTLDVNTFVEAIEMMKSYFAVLPVETGFYCKTKAFSALPYAHSSQDIERIKYLLEAKADLKNANNAKMMQYVVMFCMVLAALGGLVAILLVLGGGK